MSGAATTEFAPVAAMRMSEDEDVLGDRTRAEIL